MLAKNVTKNKMYKHLHRHRKAVCLEEAIELCQSNAALDDDLSFLAVKMKDMIEAAKVDHVVLAQANV